jgi:hypothetical protein
MEDRSPRREPWVNGRNQIKPRMGRKNFRRFVFCRPCRGLDGLVALTHGFTVGYYLSHLRRWNGTSSRSDAGCSVVFGLWPKWWPSARNRAAGSTLHRFFQLSLWDDSRLGGRRQKPLTRLEQFGKRRKEFGEIEDRKAERAGASESISQIFANLIFYKLRSQWLSANRCLG